MIVGDFQVTDKSKDVEDVLFNRNLCILNDCSYIYLHPGNGSYSSIDLTIVDPIYIGLYMTICVEAIISLLLLKGVILLIND